jgi:hypothetical protein
VCKFRFVLLAFFSRCFRVLSRGQLRTYLEVCHFSVDGNLLISFVQEIIQEQYSTVANYSQSSHTRSTQTEVRPSPSHANDCPDYHVWLRVHFHAAATRTLINFCEGVARDTLVPYSDPIFECLVKLLNPTSDNAKQSKRYIQEQANTVLAMVADASEVTFTKVSQMRLLSQLPSSLTELQRNTLFEHHTIVTQHIAQCKWRQLPKIQCEGYGIRWLDKFILSYYPDDLFTYIFG